MVGDHINRQSRSFQIMAPIHESFEDHEQFFVMGVIVEFGSVSVREWNATGCISPSGRVIERIAPISVKMSFINR